MLFKSFNTVFVRLCLGPGPLDRAGVHLPAADNVAAPGVHKAPTQKGNPELQNTPLYPHIPAGDCNPAQHLQVYDEH